MTTVYSTAEYQTLRDIREFLRDDQAAKHTLLTTVCDKCALKSQGCPGFKRTCHTYMSAKASWQATSSALHTVNRKIMSLTTVATIWPFDAFPLEAIL